MHLRQGAQLAVRADGADGRRRRVPVPAVPADDRAAPAALPAVAQPQERIRAVGHPAGDAVARQLPDVLPKGGQLKTKQGRGEPNPDWLPIAHEIAREYAAKADADTGNIATDIFNIPATAHYIGGCTIGDSPDTGVIDPYQRVYGHPGLHIADGSAITANLGVNPSLTITAQAERAMAFWPNKGESDPRPALGAPYQRISPVEPHRPAVPASAPGALRLPASA